jgi:integrase
MASEKLTALKVSKARAPGMFGDGRGLWLRVVSKTSPQHEAKSAGGSRSWVFRFMLAGRAREMGLGAVADVSLSEARELARAARSLVRQGVDPIDQRQAHRLRGRLEAAKAVTFRQCAERYIAAHAPGWRNAKHAAQWPSTLQAYAYPVFGSLPVQAVDVALVMRAVEPIWTTKPETASRVRGRIESVLDWATARGYRQGENPARWRGHLENLLPKKSKVRRVEHHAALAYVDLADFMVSLRQQEGVAARALEFTILTAARTGSVLGAQWPEIDLESRLWTIPAERMKAGQEHRVPLSGPAIAVLERMQEIRSGDFVFSGARAQRPLSNMAFLTLLRRIGRGDLTAHGFRSTFSDWCAEQTNFPEEVRKMALAHAVGDKVEAAYRRGDLFEKRRRLMDAWARQCDLPTPRGEVVPIAAAG